MGSLYGLQGSGLACRRRPVSLCGRWRNEKSTESKKARRNGGDADDVAIVITIIIIFVTIIV